MVNTKLISNASMAESGISGKDKLKLFYLLVIILFANEFLNFGWWTHVQGVFNIADIGNAAVWGTLGVLLLNKHPARMFRNSISLLILFYLLFVLIQICLGTLYYGQPLLKGLIGARHQFYFASFFVFWVLLDSIPKIRFVLNGIVIIALIAVILGLINYFGPTVLTHRWAEGHRIRSGIVRAFFPGMSIISAATIWITACWIENPSRKGLNTLGTILFVAIHIFRQTRMRLFGLISIIILQVLSSKKLILIFVTVFLFLVIIAGMNIFTDDNIFLSLLNRTADDLEHGSGSWKGRLIQLNTDFEEFMRHPLIGSGTSTIRIAETKLLTKRAAELRALAAKSDLGYTHWIKAYGLVGMTWLVLFFGNLIIRALRVYKTHDSLHADIANFCFSYLLFIMGTFITLNHLMETPNLVIVCLLAAIIMRLNELDTLSNK